MDPDGKGGGAELAGVEREGNHIKIQFVRGKTNLFSIRGENMLPKRHMT